MHYSKINLQAKKLTFFQFDFDARKNVFSPHTFFLLLSLLEHFKSIYLRINGIKAHFFVRIGNMEHCGNYVFVHDKLLCIRIPFSKLLITCI